MFLKIWRDPVWSKVISVGIITLIGAIYVYVKSIIDSQSFSDSFNNLIYTKLDVWIVLLILLVEFVIVFFIVKSIFRLRPSPETPGVSYTDAQIEHDKKLLKEIKSELPGDGSIQFIRNNNFAGNSFFWEELDDFDFVIENIQNPEIRFINKDLEKIRSDFFEKIKTYRSYLASKTFTVDVQDGQRRATVPPEWENDQPERFWEVVNTLHESADEICKVYDQLISTSKQLYGI